MDDAFPQEEAAAAPDDMVERLAAAATRDWEFTAGERFVRRPMPTLDIVNEKLSRNLRMGFFQFVRRSPEIAIAPVEVLRFSEFLGGVALPTNFNIVSMKPLRGNGLVVCEAQLISLLVDTLYGGSGRMQASIEGRDFSPAEQRVIQRLLAVVCTELTKAWKDVYPIELTPLRSEVHPQFVNIAAPAEMVVVTTITVTIGDYAGAIRICQPYGAFEPIRDMLYGAQQAQALAEDRRWVSMLTREIQAAEVTLAVELAQPELTVGQLLTMKPGDFIQFDRPGRVVASVDGAPVFSCQYGTHNARYALRIDECLRGDEPHWLGASHVQ